MLRKESEITNADIKGVVVNSRGKAIGSAKNRIWEPPITLNIMANIYEDTNTPSDKYYRLYCGIKSGEKFIDDGFKFGTMHGSCGDKKNPCVMEPMAKGGTISFRVTVSKLGAFTATLGNTDKSNEASQTFQVVEKFIPEVHGK